MQEIKMFFNTLSRSSWQKEWDIEKVNRISPVYVKSIYREKRKVEKQRKEIDSYENDFIDLEIDGSRYRGIKYLKKTHIKDKLSKLLKQPTNLILNEDIKLAYENNLNKMLSKVIMYKFRHNLPVYYRIKYFGEQTNTWWYEKGPLSNDNEFRQIGQYYDINYFGPHYEHMPPIQYIENENKFIFYMNMSWFYYGNSNTPYYEKSVIYKKLIGKTFKIIPVIDGVTKDSDFVYVKFVEEKSSNKLRAISKREEKKMGGRLGSNIRNLDNETTQTLLNDGNGKIGFSIEFN